MTRNLLNKNKRALTVLVLLIFATLVSGCNKKQPPAPVAAPAVPVHPSQQPNKPVQKQASSATLKLVPPPSGPQFDFSNKKDPFKPDISVKGLSASTPADMKKALKNGLPIHSFDVSQFKLIGIVTGSRENSAMVVDPNGKGYVLKTGMTIGKNDGRVTGISIRGVDVVEQFKDDSGRVRRENIRITLPRKQ